MTDRDTWALGVAEAVSKAAKCSRRQVGAVILKRDGTPVSFGYNGAPPGVPHCDAGACPRGSMTYADQSAGSGYDNCIGDHAERNAIAFAPAGTVWADCVLYVTSAPCTRCRVLIEACGFHRVIHPETDTA